MIEKNSLVVKKKILIKPTEISADSSSGTNSSIMGGGGAKTLPYFNQVEF